MFHGNNRSGDPDEVVISMCALSSLYKMNEYYQRYEPDEVVVTFDAFSWRKAFTDDLTKCVTNKKYKGHRRTNKTPTQMRLFSKLDAHIQDFADMLNERSRIIVLQKEGLEGDDLMAAWVQMHRNDEHIVISGDQDMMQLLQYSGVKVVDPATGKERSLDDWGGDVDLFMFEKYIRGEAKTNDNIQSAYPRLYKTKMHKAFYDEYLMTELMDHTFFQMEELPDGTFEEIEYRTGDLVKENKKLMCLTEQPKSIKKMMTVEVERGKVERGKYRHLDFLAYCKANDLKAIIDRIEFFVPFLAVK